MGDLTKVTVDFETSHLVFPTIIACVLTLLGIVIVIRDRRRIAASGTYWAEVLGKMDKVRFFGTIALTLVYFSLMVPVGNIWPNTGMGFLLCSIPFVFLSGVLFLHDRDIRSILTIGVVAVVSPTLVWWLFTDLFFLTLP
ncbi:tripartite tricarboxylate transporter TctB family protein [Nitratireductor luteus]|uniref:tripartite tricarboxylate transporter TctB family protein n=1 Tax=Nitratireductor luteus TaxID=2976980 RepID=UPI00223F9DAC|nr:tripartite tricarboxylate transporter TctB family protein [Nitratireductor luteus]